MHIESLKLYNFRNLEDCTVSFSPGANFIIGPNGQGKTNLVEAINLLSLGRSFRTVTLRDLIRWKADACSVFADVCSSSGNFQLGIAIDGESRKAYLNGEQVDFMGDFLGRLMCISFSPTDLALIKGSPQERRKFIDKHLVDLDPHVMTTLVEYHRALRNKNVVLKGGVSDARMLDSWNTLLAENAVKIHNARVTFIERLQELVNSIYQRFSKNDGEVTMRLKSSIFPAELPATVEMATTRLEHARDREILIRSSAIGPHRDEIVIELGGKSARAFASQGQSRTLVLAMKLSVLELLEKERSESPIILLDDVESELDSSRRRALEELVRTHRCQIFVTGTSLPQGGYMGARTALELHIQNGRVEEQKLS